MSLEVIELRTVHDVARLRDRMRRWTKELGFGNVRATKVITAASELGRNTVTHGAGGRVELEPAEGPNGRVGIRMRFIDEGPGIADLAAAMTDGFTTATGLGLGLSGSRRLLGGLEVKSRPGATVIEGTAWKK